MDKKILAIDDVTINLMVIKEILKEFDVRVAKTGEMGLYVLGSVDIDLLLIDIDLPGMSGFEFLEIVREIPDKKDLPAIFVTAHATPDFILKANEMGAVGYVVKPINAASLRSKVTQALDIEFLD